MKNTMLCAVVAVFAGMSQTATRQTKWDAAAAEIVRIPPDAFAEVPPRVRSFLTGFGCAIPQAWGTDRPHNVVSGSFAQRGQTDWAALCSSDGSSAVHIVWGGDASCPTPIAPPVADKAFLQDTGIDGILYSRGISRVRPDPRYWTAPQPFTLASSDHDAISDAFYEKGATAYYCQDGLWLEFQRGS